jgi:hypothetical protein
MGNGVLSYRRTSLLSRESLIRQGTMRYLLTLLVILLCVGAGGCSLGRHDFLQQAASKAIPIPDDGSDRKLDIHAHFQESNVTLTFTTAQSPEQVLQWYRDTLVARGWQLASEADSGVISAPAPNVGDRFLAQRRAVTRQRLWMHASKSYDAADVTKVRIQFESIGTLEDIEGILILPIDLPLAFFDDSLPGVCWYFFWLPLKDAI